MLKSKTIFIPSEWRLVNREDIYLRTDGRNGLAANMNANNFRLENVGQPKSENDSTTKIWVEDNTMNKSEVLSLIDTLNFLKCDAEGNVDMKSSRITNLPSPVSSYDAVPKNYLDSLINQLTTDRLLCHGREVIASNQKFTITDMMTELGDRSVFPANQSNSQDGHNMTQSVEFDANILAKIEVWLHLRQMAGASIIIDFLKNEDLIFSKFFSCGSERMENAAEFCSHVGVFDKGDIFSIAAETSKPVDVEFYLQISNFVVK